MITKLYSVEANLTIYKEREVDVLIYAHPRIVDLLDVLIDVQVPTQKKFDVLITPFRQVEWMDDPFDTHKEDTPSFFESYESDDRGIVNSNLLSTDLKAIAPLSRRLRKPIGQFHSLHTLSEQYHMSSDDDRYVAMLPKELRLLVNMKDYYRNFWFTVIRNKTKTDKFIDYSKSKTPHLDAFAQFDFSMDNVELYQEHLTDCSTIPSVGEKNERILIAYSGLLFLPYLRHYTFGIGAGSANNADELVEIYIDDENVVSSYKYDGEQVESKDIILSEGFHTVTIIRLYRVGDFEHKDIYGKQDTVQFSFEVTDIANKTGIEVYSPSYLFYVDDLNRFIIYPFDFFTNEVSIMMQKYLPITILSIPDKEEMSKSYYNNYKFAPDVVETIAADFSYSSAFNDITYQDPNTITKTDPNKPTILTFKYKDALIFNSIILNDTSQPIAQRFNFIKLRVFDSVGDYKDVERLLKDIDYDLSFNIKSARAEFGWLIVERQDARYGLQIKFKTSFESIGLDLSIPVKDTYQIDEISIGAIKYSNFVVATQSGKFYELDQMDYYRMEEVTTKFDDIVAIPELFRHVELPRDIKNSSDFVIFGLMNYDPLNIKILGTAFDIWNKDKVKHTEHRYLAIHNLWGNKYEFNIYDNWDKNLLYDWNHVAYDATNDKIVVDGLGTITCTIYNLTSSDINNGVFILSLPHYEHSWTATVNGTTIPVVGANIDNTGKPTIYVKEYNAWHSNYVAIQTSISANSSVQVVLQAGDFGNTSAITGTVVPSENYYYEFDKTDTSIIVTDAGIWPPKSLRTIYALEDKTVTKSTTIQNDRDILTMYIYDVINTTGNPVQSEFLLDMSAFRKMYGRHVPFKLVDATTYQPIDFLYRNAVDDYTKYFSQWTGDTVAVRWNDPPNLMQSILKKYADEGFTKYIDIQISGWNYGGNGYQQDEILFIRYGGKSGHPSNHDGLINDYNYTDLKYIGLRQDINTGNYGDYYDMYFCTWLYVQEEGVWSFAVDSDDASEVEIDGTIVASWYGGHGVCNCQDHNGTITLTAGLHKLIYRHEEDTGGDWARLWFKSPSMSTWETFTTTNLAGKAVCYAKQPTDDEVKTLDFIKYGFTDSPMLQTVKLSFDDTKIDFSALNADISNIKFVSDLLTDFDFKIINVDTTNQTFDALVYPSEDTKYINKETIYVVYGGYPKPAQTDTLQDSGSYTSYAEEGSGDLIPPKVDHRHEGTKLLVLPGQYITQQEDAYTLPYIDNLQSPIFWYACTPAKIDYSNYQHKITFVNEDDIDFTPDKDGREAEAIELLGDSYFYTEMLSTKEDAILQIRYKGTSSSTTNHEQLIDSYIVTNVLTFDYVDNIYTTTTSWGDYYCLLFVTFIDVEEEGTWHFRIAGDDIAELQIDDTIVAYGYDGTCCSWRYGSIDLTKGKHLLIARHKEYAGGDWLHLEFQSPSMDSYEEFNLTNLQGKASCSYYDITENAVKTKEFIETGYPTVLSDWTLSLHFFTVRKDKQLVTMDDNKLSLFVNSNGLVELKTDDLNTEFPVNVVDGLWHHIAISKGQSSVVYIDSIPFIVDNLPSNINKFVFGLKQDADYMVGRFDEIRIYDREVTLPEAFVLHSNLKVEFIPPDVKVIPSKSPSIDYPTSITTSLIDLKDKTGTAVILHKYRNIPTIVVELLSNIFAPI